MLGMQARTGTPSVPRRSAVAIPNLPEPTEALESTLDTLERHALELTALDLSPVSQPLQGSQPSIGLPGVSRLGDILRPSHWSTNVRLFMSIMRLASIVLVAYWALIFFGTHIPKASMPSLNASDKVYHCGAFMGLSFLLCWAIPSSRFSLSKILILTASIALTYAVVDEWTQQFIPGRTCDIWDVAADSVGVALGLLAYLIARPIVRRLKWAQRLLAPSA